MDDRSHSPHGDASFVIDAIQQTVHCLGELRLCFGEQFHIYCREDDWFSLEDWYEHENTRTGHCDDECGESAESVGVTCDVLQCHATASDQLTECYRSNEPAILFDQSLVIPLKRLVRLPAIAVCHLRPSSLDKRERTNLLARARYFIAHLPEQRELRDLRQSVDSYAAQISDNFEELTFLRGVAQNLELANAIDTSLLVSDVFPFLLNALKAREVIFVRHAGDGATAEELDRHGESQVAPATVRALVERFANLAQAAPVVRNLFAERGMDPDGCSPYSSSPAEFHDANNHPFDCVQDFVMVPVSKYHRTYGWLLAINRVNRQPWDPARHRVALSANEFGTGEASILASAAALLATNFVNAELFTEKEKLLTSVVRSMVSAIEAKDNYTCGHSERVALYARRLGRELQLNKTQCEQLYLTGLLHDVGKIGVSDQTLRKPGKLTDDEFNEIKQHPDLGWSILCNLDSLRYVFPGVVHHHEHFDGTGYPDRLSGEAIPRDGRILAVCDAYDAMTSDRPYRRGMPQEKAEQILHSGAGKQWDPTIIDAFFACMDGILDIRHGYQSPSRQVRTPGTTTDI